MRVLVTGGCGFIGSNFIRYMLGKYPDYKIINLDKLTYCGCKENLADIEKDDRYEFVEGDICDEKTVDRSVRNSDFILNFAAESHVDRSIKDASGFIETNLRGVQVILDAAKKYKVRKTVQISTDEVYGSIENGSFTEESLLHPNSPYSASKAGGDHLALAYYMTFNLPVVVTRSSNNFGPYQFPEKVIPLFITNLLEGEKVPLYGDGLNVRDWLYVLDNCRAIDLVLHKGRPGEIYNIGGGYEMPNKKLTQIVLKLLNKGGDMIEYVPDRLGHDRRYSIDSAKVRRLGWQPTEAFDTAIRETVEWYKENERWWRNKKHQALNTKL